MGSSRSDPPGAARRQRCGLHGRRRSSRRAAVRGAVRRRDAQHPAGRRVDCRRCWLRRPLPRRTAASTRTPASIRLRSCARVRAEHRRAPGRRGRIDDHAADCEAAAELERSPARRARSSGKLQEAVLAQRLEHRFDKKEILALYLNLAAYGNQVVGAGRASYAYFGHDASMLTPAQAAFLAGLPQRPSGFNPYRNPKSALARQRPCCGGCRQPDAITAEQAREAADEQLAFTKRQTRRSRPGTSSSACLRRVGTSTARAHRDDARRRAAGGDRRNHQQPARARSIGTAPRTSPSSSSTTRRGEWLAWEGSGDYFDSAHGGAIDGVVSPRQPGSALKPFTYALGFEEGLTPATVLADIPSHFPTAEQGVLYSPRNYDGRYRGSVAGAACAGGIRERSGGGSRVAARRPRGAALPAARRLHDVRSQRVVLRAGDHPWQCGSSARRARRRLCGVRAGRRVDRAGLASRSCGRAGARASSSRLGAHRLLDRRHPLGSRRARIHLRPRRQSGVSVSGRREDRHVAGLPRQLDRRLHARRDRRRVGRQLRSHAASRFDGVTGAGPIFHAVMLAAQRRAGATGNAFADAVVADPPEGLVEREICALSGMPANPWCPSKGRERVPAAGDAAPCSWHHRSEDRLVTIWPPEYREWARKSGALTERVVNASAVVVREVRATTGARPAADDLEPARRRYLSHRPDAAPRIPDAVAPRRHRAAGSARVAGRRASGRFVIFGVGTRVAARARHPRDQREGIRTAAGRKRRSW